MNNFNQMEHNCSQRPPKLVVNFMPIKLEAHDYFSFYWVLNLKKSYCRSPLFFFFALLFLFFLFFLLLLCWLIITRVVNFGGCQWLKMTPFFELFGLLSQLINSVSLRKSRTPLNFLGFYNVSNKLLVLVCGPPLINVQCISFPSLSWGNLLTILLQLVHRQPSKLLKLGTWAINSECSRRTVELKLLHEVFGDQILSKPRVLGPAIRRRLPIQDFTNELQVDW